MLLKTILLVFFLYIALKVLGVIFRTRVIIKNFNYTDQRPQTKPEGEITINGQIKSSNSKQRNEVGEYVDYEELK
jgi:hypothetical protein